MLAWRIAATQIYKAELVVAAETKDGGHSKF
jgi:hypothetical protein